jgi:prolyl oligopeptidase
MKKTTLFLALPLCIQAQNTTSYPNTPKIPTEQHYFGKTIVENYAWLEQDTAKEVITWTEAQNKKTDSVLLEIPYYEDLQNRLVELYNYPRVNVPKMIGDFWFVSRNTGLQSQSAIYYYKEKQGEKLFADANVIHNGVPYTIDVLSASKNKKYVLLELHHAGSDFSDLQIRNLADNSILADKITKLKFPSPVWYKDGFFYSKFPKPKGSELTEINEYQSIYYHKIGTDESQDELIYQNLEKPYRYHYAWVSEEAELMVIYAKDGTSSGSMFIKNLKDPKAKLDVLVSNETGESRIIGYKNAKIYLYTTQNAPNGKLVAIDAKNINNRQDIIPESENALQGVSKAGGKLFAHYVENAQNVVYAMDYNGKNITPIILKEPGTLEGFQGSDAQNLVYFSFSSITKPLTVYSYNTKTQEIKPFEEPKHAFNPDDYYTEQVWFNSKDGTKVPMFVVHRKDIVKNGENPTLVYGYGGFNISITPKFDPGMISFLEQGGVYVVVNLRGGGEFGESWHQQGTKMNKQNVFDDFIAAAEHLIAMGYTNPKKLAIEGRSNGGLLVGACMTQRPDLYAVAFPVVGVLDMLKYQNFTIGWGWIPEYGVASESTEMFEYLLKYSPLHNVRDQKYPATLIYTADHDDRVVPLHSFKFAATLQASQQGDLPVVLRVAKNAGHGSGKPTEGKIKERAERIAFMLWHMGYKNLPYNLRENNVNNLEIIAK